MSDAAQKHLQDQSFNDLVKTGNPWIILVAVFVKYGSGPIICAIMMFALWMKDSQVQNYNSKLVELSTRMEVAIVEGTMQNKMVVKAVEDNTAVTKELLAEIKRMRSIDGH